MSTFIPPTPAATKSAEQHEEPSEQDSFNHLLFKVLRLTSEQVQDLNDWMKHQGVPNVHEIIVQSFHRPHALEDDLHFIRENKPCYIQSNVMVSLSLMITYIKHLWYSAKATYFGPFYYVQIDPQDYDEWRISTPEEEVHFQTPSKLGSPATPQSMATSQASESYITLTNFKKGIKRDASAYPIFKNERYYNTFICHFKATAKAQGLNTLMDPNFTPGSDEYEQQLFQEQQNFLYSVLISSLKTEFSEALVKDHEGDAQLILELLHEHHTGNSQYSRSEINRITKYLTNIKLDDTWRGTNESFLMHYNDQLRLLDSLVDSDEKLPDNTRVTFLESAVESVPDLRRVKITDNVLQAQLDSTRPISYRSYFDLLKDAAFHLDQATKRGNKVRHRNVHFSGPHDEDEHQTLSSDDPQVIQQEDVCSEPPEPLSYSVFQSHFQGSSTSNTQKIFLPKPIWEKLSKDQQQMIIDHNRSLPKSGSSHLSTPNKSPSPLPHKPTPQQTAKSQQVHTHQSDKSTADTTKVETTPSDTYPHVFFTSPDEWDPSVLDHDPPHLDGLDPSQVSHQPLGDPMFDAYGDFNERIIANLNILLDAPPGDCESYTSTSSFPQSISIRVHPKSLIGMPYAHSLHGHPHPASRTLSMSPPGMELLHTPRITSKSTLSLEILFSTSPDAVKLLQQTPSSLTPLLLMMVQPWPNFSLAVIPLSVMHMASNQPNNSSTPSLITSEKGEPWTPSSVMEANMKSPSESLISSAPCSFKIISLNLIINIKIRQKIALDLPSVTPTLS